MRQNSFISKDLSIASTRYAREEEYWKNQLSGELTRSYIPYDYKEKDSRETSPPLAPAAFDLPDGMFSGLLKLSKDNDYTMHMIFAAVIMILLHKYTGNRDIIVGVPIYKQDSDDEFINTVLAIRCHVRENMTFKELLIKVRQTIMQAEENQNYPIEILLSLLNIPIPNSENDFPLFDVAVLMERIHEKKYLQHIHVNIIISFRRTDRQAAGVLEYNPALYERKTVDQIVRHLLKIQGDCLANVDVKIADIELMTEEEKRQLLFDFNDISREYARDKTIVQLFAEQVEKTPDNIAAAGSGMTHEQPLQQSIQVTYRELHEASNRLARVLRGKGVGPSSIVVIMEERSVDMIAAILAVLKAGAAYLPINPETPKSRIVSLLDDARPSLVLAKNRSIAKYLFTSLQGLPRFHLEPTFTLPRPPIQNLDRLIPDRTLVNYGKYNQYIGQCMARNAIVIQASRGCPYRCAYCHKIWPKKQIFRSPESILDEMKQNLDLGIRKFAFVDDIFNLNKQKSTRFFELVIREGLHDHVQFFFPNGLRGDLLTPEYIDLIIEAGTVSLALALETASPRLQKVLAKNLDLDKFRENIEYFCQRHPHVILELFTMHGFPGETEEEAYQTLEFVKSLHWVHFPYMNVLKIYPHTDMEKIALDHGISRESIIRSEDYAHYELSDICPFDKSFSFKYRSEFLNDYFLLKQRLLHVLPFQMNVLSEDELLQKYNSYLPTDTEISSFDALLEHLKITREELQKECETIGFAAEESPGIYQANLEKLKAARPGEPDPDALRLLLLDLTQFFSTESEFFYDVSGEAPLGLMYLLTYLNEHLDTRINGKIAKSRMDFDSYDQLKTLVKECDPQVIGLRALNIYKDFFHKIISLLRQWGFKGPLVVGGPYATSDTAAVLQDKNIDLAVLSEGEVTFLEVIQAIMENQGKLPGEEVLSTVKGIAYIPEEKKRQRTFHREVVMLDELTEVLRRESADNLEWVNRPDDPAYVIFTSGSTGTPKGAIIRHQNVNNLVLGLNQCIYQDYGEGLRLAQVAPYVFDASVKQIFAALLQGNTLCIVPEEARIDSELLSEYYKKYQIDVSDGTPAHIKFMLESVKDQQKGAGLKSLSPVKHFIIGGEALPTKTAADFLKSFKGTPPKITNIYGVTECTVDSTAYEITIENVNSHRFRDSFPIGKSMSNSMVYILDRQSKPQPIGVPGELCIAGHGVGRGYLNNPELTAERFASGGQKPFCKKVSGLPKTFDHSIIPVAERSGAKLYRTGDLARWLADGNIEFLGRLDHQVKIRGYRIELGEIENQLHRFAKIKDAVVLLKEDISGDKYLCAYVVPASAASLQAQTGDSLQPTVIREYLMGYLPAYMVPTHYVLLPKIPLNQNGKVDRKALPEPQVTIGDASGYAPAEDETEEKLVELWSDLFHMETDDLSIDADFFELGGHSLKATILIARIHKAMDIKVPLVEMFRNPTIRGLAQFIRKNREVKYSDTFLEKHKPIPLVEKKEYYPLSPAMIRLYFEQQMNPRSTHYNLILITLLAGNLDFARMEDIFKSQIRRHDTLRTAFMLAEDGPVQRVTNEFEFNIEYHEIASRQEAEVTKIIEQFIRPFDLSRPPLFSVGLIKKGETQHILIVNIHHMVSDGTSLGLMMNEFMVLYDGNELPVLNLQYRDYSQWKSSEKQQRLREEQEKYWLTQFGDHVPVLNLPYDYPRPAELSHEGSIAHTVIAADEAKKIKELALREDVTPFMLFLALFNLLLMKLSGQEDIVVGTPLAGRNHADLEPLIGMFVNTLALRNYPRGNKTFKAFLQEVKEKTLKAFANQDYGFEILVKQAAYKRDPGRSPIFDVFFAVQNMEIPVMHIPGLTLKPYDYRRNMSRFDLSFQIFENNSQFAIGIEYSTRLFKGKTIELFIKNFKEIIAAVLENPAIPLQDIQISAEVRAAKPEIPRMDLGW